MKISPPQQLQRVPDLNLSRVQDALVTLTRELTSIEVIDGRLETDVALSTSEVNVRHKLGRVPKGFIVVDRDADARVWRSSAVSASVLPLSASAAVTVSLWIF